MVTTLKIHAYALDGATLDQIYRLRDHPSVDGLVAIMPDAHAGAGCVIGTTLHFNGSLVPNIVGVDIGCGILAYRLGIIDIDFVALDNKIKVNIPLGMKHRENSAAEALVKRYEYSSIVNRAIEVQKRLNIRKNPVENQLGTLGGGNHFIELGIDENGEKWILIHSGSRNFGLQVATYYQNKAREITPVGSVPKGMEYLPMNQGGEDYLKDMKVAQEFAQLNRLVMLQIILDILGVKFDVINTVLSVHNYIGDDGVCRKGAIEAYAGQEGVIPLNMKDGTLRIVGKGNPDYNNSAPHGAGRAFSRSKMKEMMRNGTYSVEDFQKSMDGVFTTTANASTIDEAPVAYKPFELVREYIEATAEIISVIKPIYNLKASGD